VKLDQIKTYALFFEHQNDLGLTNKKQSTVPINQKLFFIELPEELTVNFSVFTCCIFLFQYKCINIT